jgi:exosortase D (VPLPA-CTERM-specific)
VAGFLPFGTAGPPSASGKPCDIITEPLYWLTHRGINIVIDELQKIGRVGLAQSIVYAGLLAGIYFSTYTWLVTKDWVREDYSASMLIPLVVLYLIWEKRSDLARIPSHRSWAGVAIMLFGVFLFWLGELGGEFFTLYFSSWLLLVGLVWLHIGWRKLKIIAFPVALLLAMFPLPNFIHGKLSFNLKLISSQFGVKMMQWMGMSAYREGNVIDLGFTQLQVVDACNGLRYLIPLIILGLIIAYFYKTTWWKRTLLVLSTIPIAVLVNSLRIASVGVLYQFWGPMVAEGFFHDFSGWFIFMLTVGFLVLFMGILRLLPPREQGFFTSAANHPNAQEQGGGDPVSDQEEIPSAKEASSEPTPVFTPPFLTACCLLGVTLGISIGVDFHEQMPINRPLADFPATIAEWQGQRQSMEQQFIDRLDLSDYMITDFRNGDGKSVNFYVAYYRSQRKGESIHSPATCMPGGGWVFRQSGKTTVPLANGASSMPVKRAFMQKGEARQLSYFWYPMRGRVLTNAYEMKLFNFWDALTRQRTDGALVRLITPLYGNESVEMAEARLRAFMGDVVPVLDQFLPQ